MYKKDYIQRQFEEFGKVLASLLLLKRQKNWQEYENLMYQAFQNYSGSDGDVLEELNTDAFQREVLENDSLNFEQKKFMAHLLFEKMNMYLEKGDETNYQDLKEKCLLLYRWLQNDQTENEFDLDIHYKLKLLEQ